MKDGRRSASLGCGSAVVTTEGNEMVADIHDRMPAILAPSDYACWLSDDPDPCDLMCPFPAGLIRMWPVSADGTA
jgi:putative SOS response-associated peptidase YedK